MQNKLEKIDRFIDKYLNWNVLKNLILSDICLMPYMFIIGLYDIPRLRRIIIISSICMSMHFIKKATKSIRTT